MKTYLFAGASSAMAKALYATLDRNTCKVISLTTQETLTGIYDEQHLVTHYATPALPALDVTLDGIVYFPGTVNLKPFSRVSEEDFVNDFKINALGAAQVIQKYLPNLKKSLSASVVLISSVAVTTGMPFHASIAMAKAAIEGLTKSLAAELAPAIRVNAISPSLVDTPLTEKLVNTPEKLDASAKRHALKRIGRVEDIAAAIKFLLSDESAWITGMIMPVDGGMSAVRG
jgi:3-oxoacyl-[acyl-carrier protein] reductase